MNLTSPDFIRLIDGIKNDLEISAKKNNRTKDGQYFKLEYYNIACAFDIETTSTYSKAGTKIAFMYHWTFGIRAGGIDYLTTGRTWDKFVLFLRILSRKLELNEHRRMVCFVHNLSFDFQFFRKHFNFQNVFSLRNYEPVYAVSDLGIEFRCSYILSGKNLNALADETPNCPPKLVGDLDYNLIRHSTTLLSYKDEKQYCFNDVIIILRNIEHRINTEGSIIQLPLTKTGYVRKFVKDACFKIDPLTGEKLNKNQSANYRKLMNMLTIEPGEYKVLRRAFSGGFVHGSIFHLFDVIPNVATIDFNSSYPAVAVRKRHFPASKGRSIKIKNSEHFRECLNLYCCVFDIVLENVTPLTFIDNPISSSKCLYISDDAVLNNGRVVFAQKIALTVTDLDFKIFEKYYKWDSMKIGEFWIYKKGYLPPPIVKSILYFYQKKTELKGIEGKELEYALMKELLNSIYGMMVTDPCRDEIIYADGEWTDPIPADVDDIIEKYNKNRKRFLFYPWGIFITANARYLLLESILKIGDDYVYSDTDSIKMMNYENHVDFIDEFNASVIRENAIAMEHFNLPIGLTCPVAKNGKLKHLGVWDTEPTADEFKTLGAKRYFCRYGDTYKLTCSGLGKKEGATYLVDNFKNPFDGFSNRLYVPPNLTGKLTHTYIDTETRGLITDYQGKKGIVHELSSVHLSGADYTLNIAEALFKYLMGVRNYNE